MWNWRMFLLTGEAKYLDVLELALYNSILSSVSLSGAEFFYTNPLRVVDPLPVTLRYPRTRQKFFTSFCCPPNVVRTIAEVGGYAYSTTSDSLLVNLYGTNTLETTLGKSPLKITQKTDYPWDGKVRIAIDECGEEEFAIKLRIPGWCKGATISVNDESFKDATTPGSYAEVRRTWKTGDVIELNLPMPAQLITANPLVEEVQHQVAVKRGPVVYCIESADLPKGVEVENVVIPSDGKLTANYSANILDGVATIETDAIAESPAKWGNELYRPKQASAENRFRLRLIPYYAWANRGVGEMTVWLPVK